MAKEWRIEEFLRECDALQRNPYTYDFTHMPAGACNGHKVKSCNSSLAAVIIDGVIINMGVINDRYPDGSVCFGFKDRTMTGLEYVRFRLEREGATC